MSERLAAKVIVITGAGSGIGAHTAATCAQAGAAVICADIDPEAAERTASAIADSGAKSAAVQVDVSDEAAANAMATAALEAFGKIDGLFANAGITGEGSAASLSLADWNRVIAVNLTGVFLSCRAVLPSMVDAGAGAIVATSSIGGLVGVPNIAAYAAAKGGVTGLVRQMAVDYAPDGVRVNAICPGTIPTPLVVSAYEQRNFIAGDVDDAFARAASRFPLGRVGTLDDAALLTLFLLSEESGWITGQSLAVDGGVSTAGWQVGQ
ncbi:SDR family NAD(P)-dependent oxidoreductase [Ilumatobacter sp.]|uniref:SDR family NAD(P)-dependent oxidoreductase n=1 Tax=Ilumatobacter sp. TaxID=1967498 RepID=UPI0037518E1F